MLVLATTCSAGAQQEGRRSFSNEMGNKVSLPTVVPRVKAQDDDEEEEMVDPQQNLRDQCHENKHCQALHEKYTACNDRVSSRKKTTEMCSEELFDYLHCIDACVTKQLFSHLK